MTFACMSEVIRLHPTFLSVYLFYRYKIHDILFSNHGPLKGIKGTCTSIQRKNHNYIEYSYTMTYLSQHIKSNKQ